MKIEEKYITEFKEILKDYYLVHQDIQGVEKKIHELRNQSEFLNNRLSNIRSHEKNMRMSIEKKYGNGTLNLETWEWDSD